VPHHLADDQRTTIVARLSGAQVHAELVLKIPAPVDPVEAGAVGGNARLQHGAHPRQQGGGFLQRQRVGAAQGVQAGAVQGFIGVNVAHPRQKGLVQQQGLKLPPGGMQALVKFPGAQVGVKRLGTQPRQHPGRVFCQPDATKLARVIKRHPRAVLEGEEDAVVRLGRQVGGFHPQVAAHPQVDEQHILREVQPQVLAAPVHPLHALTGQAGLKRHRTRHGNRTLPQHAGAGKMAPQDGFAAAPPVAQGSDNGFHFRQFRHTASVIR